MKRIQKLYSTIIVAISFFSLFLLCACTAGGKRSNEVLKEMRNRYPYCQTANASMGKLPEEKWAKGLDIFAIVELTGARTETTEKIHSNQKVDANLTTNVTTHFLQAEVLTILDIRDGCFLTEQEISISFPGILYDPNLAFESGQKLVIFGGIHKSDETGKTVIGIDPIMSFYLTNDNYVLSLSHHEQLDQFSGLKLDAFKKEMLRITELGGWHQQ